MKKTVSSADTGAARAHIFPAALSGLLRPTFLLVLTLVPALVFSLPALYPGQNAALAAKAGRTTTVYDKQPPVTDKELLGFLELLPQFRAWAKSSNEEAHPVLRNGKADFLYSAQAAAWVQGHGWVPARFFCVMGRMAAALVIVEEGNSQSARARDMPEVTDAELALARRHLGSLLRAGGDVPPVSR